MPDVVVKGFLDENDARSLWQLYYAFLQLLFLLSDAHEIGIFPGASFYCQFSILGQTRLNR